MTLKQIITLAAILTIVTCAGCGSGGEPSLGAASTELSAPVPKAVHRIALLDQNLEIPESWIAEQQHTDNSLNFRVVSPTNPSTNKIPEITGFVLARNQESDASEANDSEEGNFVLYDTKTMSLKDGSQVITEEYRWANAQFGSYKTNIVLFETILDLGSAQLSLYSIGEFEQYAALYDAQHSLLASTKIPSDSEIDFALAIAPENLHEELGMPYWSAKTFDMGEYGSTKFMIPDSWSMGQKEFYGTNFDFYTSPVIHEGDFQDFVAVGLVDYRDLPRLMNRSDDSPFAGINRDGHATIEFVTVGDVQGDITKLDVWTDGTIELTPNGYGLMQATFRYGEHALVFIFLHEKHSRTAFEYFLDVFTKSMELPEREFLAPQNQWTVPFTASSATLDSTMNRLWLANKNSNTVEIREAASGQLLNSTSFEPEWRIVDIQMNPTWQEAYILLEKGNPDQYPSVLSGRLVILDSVSLATKSDWAEYPAFCQIIPYANDQYALVPDFDPLILLDNVGNQVPNNNDFSFWDNCRFTLQSRNQWSIMPSASTNGMYSFWFDNDELRPEFHDVDLGRRTVSEYANYIENRGILINNESQLLHANGRVFDISARDSVAQATVPDTIAVQVRQDFSYSEQAKEIHLLEYSPHDFSINNFQEFSDVDTSEHERFLTIVDSTDWSLKRSSLLPGKPSRIFSGDNYFMTMEAQEETSFHFFQN